MIVLGRRQRLVGVAALLAFLASLAACSGGAGDDSGPTSPTPTHHSAPAGSAGPGSISASTPATPDDWTRIVDPRTGIGLAEPKGARVVDTVAVLAGHDRCQRRSWIGTQGQRPIIQVSVDIETHCTRPITATDLRQVPAIVAATERQAGGMDVTTSPLQTSDLGDGSVAADFIVAYSQVGGARQTAAWYVRAIATRSAIVIVQTIAFPDDNNPIPASSVRPVHDDVLSFIDLP